MILNLSGRDEFDRRRPDFAGGVAVVLADGATWYLPRIIPRLTRPVVGEAGLDIEFEWAVGPGPDPEFHNEYESATQALFNYIETEGDDSDDPEISRLHTNVISVMLRRNYTLTQEEAAWLALYGFDSRGDHAGVAAVQAAYVQIHVGVAEAQNRLIQGLPQDGPDDQPYRVGDN